MREPVIVVRLISRPAGSPGADRLHLVTRTAPPSLRRQRRRLIGAWRSLTVGTREFLDLVQPKIGR